MKGWAHVKQGCWFNWESVERKKLSWRDLWNMEESCIRFLLGATYDVLRRVRLRPGVVLWSVSQWIVYFTELTVPWEDSAYERKKLRFADLEQWKQWKVRVHGEEVGCRGLTP